MGLAGAVSTRALEFEPPSSIRRHEPASTLLRCPRPPAVWNRTAAVTDVPVQDRLQEGPEARRASAMRGALACDRSAEERRHGWRLGVRERGEYRGNLWDRARKAREAATSRPVKPRLLASREDARWA